MKLHSRISNYVATLLSIASLLCLSFKPNPVSGHERRLSSMEMSQSDDTHVKQLVDRIEGRKNEYWELLARNDFRGAFETISKIYNLETSLFDIEANPLIDYKHQTSLYHWIDLIERVEASGDARLALDIAKSANRATQLIPADDHNKVRLLMLHAHLSWRHGDLSQLENTLSNIDEYVGSDEMPIRPSLTLCEYFSLRAALLIERGLGESDLVHLRAVGRRYQQWLSNRSQFDGVISTCLVELANTIAQGLLNSGFAKEANVILGHAQKGNVYLNANPSARRLLILGLARSAIVLGDYNIADHYLSLLSLSSSEEQHPIRRALHNFYYFYLKAVLAESQGNLYSSILRHELALRSLSHPLLSTDSLHPLIRVRGNYSFARSLLAAQKGLLALKAIKHSEEILVNWLYDELPQTLDALRSTQGLAIPNTSYLIAQIAAVQPEGAELSLTSRLNRQGLLAEIQERQALLARQDSETRDLAEQVAGLTNRLASVDLPPERREDLQEQRNQLERQLLDRLPDLRLEPVSIDQVRSALVEVSGRHGVLVEFQKYRPLEGFERGAEVWGEAHYIALILKPDGSITVEKLGAASELEKAIATALLVTKARATAGPGLTAQAADVWKPVSDALLQPLLPHLKDARQWFFSLDGELNRIPIAALPLPGTRDLVGEAIELRLLTSGRDLLTLRTPAAGGSGGAQTAPPAPAGAVVMAAPAYDRRPIPSSVASPAAPVHQSGSRRSMANLPRWPELDFADDEGTAIAKMLGIPEADGQRLRMGADATSEALLTVQRPQVLHVATHGFFLESAAKPVRGTSPPSQAAARSNGANTVFGSLVGRAGEDPMLASGLVMAGANRLPRLQGAAPEGLDDGYATAKEMVAMNLEGTELVVLSACDTARGSEALAGEGFYGLQRALTVAGARSTLLSLWKVDDESTAVFMSHYYRNLKDGMGRWQALTAAQQTFRTQTEYVRKGWDDPYHWAGFQLTGDWRPIPGL